VTVAAAFLRQTELLGQCSDGELTHVLDSSEEMTLTSGELLFSEEDRADAVWIVLDGELVVTKLVDNDEVVLDELHAGAYLGEISLLTGTRAQHRARGKGTVRLLRIPGDVFRDLVRSCDAIMETVLRTLAERMRRVERLLQERERMASLGTLAAGLAHELKNPAAAAARATDLLKEQLAALDPVAQRLALHSWTPDELKLLEQMKNATASVDQAARELDPVARSDREERVGAWLEANGIERAWQVAPVLVDRGVSDEELARLTRGCDVGAIADALAWTERVATMRQLLEDVGQSTARISEIVRAVKAYAYVDATALRTTDVHEGIENSLTILGHKLRAAQATIERDYDRRLAPIQTFGTELNQVWTNLLDNAADAVAATPNRARTIRVRTFASGGKGDGIAVEIADTGAGIPPEIRSKIFDSFFTTKEAGKGTGLGLQIAKRIVARHHGTLDVTSVPGDTRFVVRLPLTQPPAAR
jgi:signal transduction histidine kinase